MTIEEFRDFANCLKNNYTIDFDKLSEFCDMAISALSTEGEYIKKSELLQHVTTEELSDYKDCDVIHAEEIDKLITYSFSDSAENKGDLISRQAVLDELEKWDWQDLYLPIHFKQILDDVPSVENKGEWIPVTEELPEEGKNVLFCDIDDDIMFGYHLDLAPATHFIERGAWEDVKNIRAWMELPEPYKGGDS